MADPNLSLFKKLFTHVPGAATFYAPPWAFPRHFGGRNMISRTSMSLPISLNGKFRMLTLPPIGLLPRHSLRMKLIGGGCSQIDGRMFLRCLEIATFFAHRVVDIAFASLGGELLYTHRCKNA